MLLGSLLAVATIAVPMAWGIHFHLLGLAEAATGSLLLVACSSLALNGSRVTPLPARRAGAAVLATTAANAVTPAGIGGTLLVLRVHRKSGLSAEEAAAAAGLRTAFGALCATGITAVVASTVGMKALPSGRLGLLVLLGLVTALAVAAACAPGLRRRAAASAARFGTAVWQVVRRPRCFACLVVGCTGVTVAQLVTLQGAVHAVGGHVPWADLLVALLGSAAARSAVPSPGGVGPIEAALVTGLTALGLGWGTAATAVAVYRTAGHWLPVLAGMLSLRELHRRQLV